MNAFNEAFGPDNTSDWRLTPLSTTTLWTILPVLLLLIAVLGCIANGTALLAVLKDRSPRASFDVYVMYLFALNVASSILQYPFVVLVSLHEGKWLLGDGVCTWYMFLLCLLNAGCVNIHALIAINRNWAIIHPLSYRAHHSPRFSVQMCGGLTIYIGLFTGIYWALDSFIYRLPVQQYGCQLNAAGMPVYTAATSLLIYILPILLILFSLPVVWIKKLMRVRTVRHGTLGQTADMARRNHSRPASNARFRVLSGSTRNSSGKYLVLALMTCSVALCYLPATVYYVLSVLVPGLLLSGLYRVASLLYPCQIILDPILLIFSWGKLRMAVSRLFRRRVV